MNKTLISMIVSFFMSFFILAFRLIAQVEASESVEVFSENFIKWVFGQGVFALMFLFFIVFIYSSWKYFAPTIKDWIKEDSYSRKRYSTSIEYMAESANLNTYITSILLQKVAVSRDIVLSIEDNIIDSSVINSACVEICKKYGVDIMIRNSIKSAAEDFSRARVMILDLMLPDMKKIESAKNLIIAINCPVIIYSGSEEYQGCFSDLEKAVFVKKPKILELKTELEAALIRTTKP